jgi:hypothetical protein
VQGTGEGEMTGTTQPKWKVDRSVPVALIVGMMVQTAGIVWWAASTTSRVEVLEKTQVTAERVARIEEQNMSLREVLIEVKSDVKRLLDQRFVDKKG